MKGLRACSTLLMRSLTPLPRRLYPARLLARTCSAQHECSGGSCAFTTTHQS